ncbi:hypothetical protein BGW37DRAFT_560333 [Umbelopsis sp. PMI_123]|nr:hypothetical protein BGW37DRAFT_560333 [Umbelopsis sp. PMI_123]
MAMATGCGYIALLLVVSITHEWIDMRIWHHGMLNDLGARGSLIVELYSKALKRREITTPKATSSNVSSESSKVADQNVEKENNSSIGNIVNMISTDTFRIANFAGVTHECIRSPVELTVVITLLYGLLGNSCFLGLLILLIALPLNHYATIMLSSTQRGLMETRDRRIGTTTEIIRGIRQVKLFAWESRWRERITIQRSEELNQLWKIAVAKILFNIIWSGTPLFVSVISLWSYTKIAGNELTAATAFTALLIFDELRFALNVLPHWMSDLTQVIVSLARVDTYLNGDELSTVEETDCTSPIRIGFENATISWTELYDDNDGSRVSSPSSSDNAFSLRNITVDFPICKLSIVCGPTGAGKTLLIMGLLGEAYISNGNSYCPRSSVSDDMNTDDKDITIRDENWILEDGIAYVSQNPWLQNASIMDNILFGLPLNYQRYQSVIDACALVRDFTLFPDGDQTEIGEKGITLSGGQKARVALARAVYSRAKHVLMDDVLSAVDAYTAKHLYENCIMGPLLSERSRILITHNVRLCFRGASNIVWVEKGEIMLSGDPTQLEKNTNFQYILRHEDVALEMQRSDSEELWSSVTTLPRSKDLSNVSLNSKDDNKQPKILVEAEKRAQGYVKTKLFINWRIHHRWIPLDKEKPPSRDSQCWPVGHASQSIPQALLLLGHVHAPLMHSGVASEHDVQAPPGAPHAVSDLSILRYAVVNIGALNAGRLLFSEMLECVFRAPLRFFDTTPVGRILNRFAKDMETIDSMIGNYIVEFFVALINVVSVLLLIGVIIPWLIAPLAACIPKNE